MKKTYKILTKTEGNLPKYFLQSFNNYEKLKIFIKKIILKEKQFGNIMEKIYIYSFIRNEKKEIIYKQVFELKTF